MLFSITNAQIIDLLQPKRLPMRQLPVQNMNNETTQVEKTATVLIRKIRGAILHDVFKPGDWLPELDLAKRFQKSDS